MFNESYFPTPVSVIQKMLEPYRYERSYGVGYQLGGRTILEPSAGNGAILDFLKDKAGVNQKKMYCCELDTDLQLILQGKGYKVIASDFLEYKNDYCFDLIIGNPPFSNGDEHLLKAWDILEEGEIIFLLNAETVLNPFSKRRKLLADIIEQHGGYELLGNVFATAERKTDVNVALVRLKKVAQEKKFNFKFENRTRETHFELNEETLQDQVATLNVVENMVLQYGKLKEAYTEFLKANARLEFYSQGLLPGSTPLDALNAVLKGVTGQNPNEKYNSFCDESKMQVWRQVIQKIGIERYMTKAVQKEFSQFTQTQGTLDFTIENIQALVSMLVYNSGSILEKAVVDVFDIFTRYHKENRLHVEGWKTNDRWKVNKKVILPAFLSSDFASHYHANYNRWSEYADIDKVMCYLTGKRYEDFRELVKPVEYSTKEYEKQYRMVSLEHAVRCVKICDSSLHESEFFYFRCYKKGTLHITFKDEFLWQEFNHRACDGKKWLPEAEKKAWQQQKKKRKSTSNYLQLA